MMVRIKIRFCQFFLRNDGKATNGEIFVNEKNKPKNNLNQSGGRNDSKI